MTVIICMHNLGLSAILWEIISSDAWWIVCCDVMYRGYHNLNMSLHVTVFNLAYFVLIMLATLFVFFYMRQLALFFVHGTFEESIKYEGWFC